MKRTLVAGAMLLFAVSLVSSWILLGKIETQRRDVEYELSERRFPSESMMAPTQPEGIDSSYFETNVRQLIQIETMADVEEKRRNLVSFLWDKTKLPVYVAKVVIRGHKDPKYKKIQNLSRIDMLSVVMEFNLVSTIYHFIPKHGNGNVILYHQGHLGDFHFGKHVIQEFLKKGYSVLAFSMPLLGENNKTDVYLERFGVLRVEKHNHMKFLTPWEGHPLQYFVEPVTQAINYLDENYEYSVIAMTGISGGGWTTTISAAIDPRIIASFPVAGTMPIYLRSKVPEDWGDWEQTVPEFYQIANYLELYVLGASGLGRKQLQILNAHDECCFNGFKSQTYGSAVRSTVQEVGNGEYDLFLDVSHDEHKISNIAIDVIDQEIQKLSNSF